MSSGPPLSENGRSVLAFPAVRDRSACCLMSASPNSPVSDRRYDGDAYAATNVDRAT
jgi:hypothetical protein